MILYEYPFNESIRTQLRLERLFSRFSALCQREEPTDHHFALASLFEIMDVASQMDVRADIIKNLERHQSLFLSYQGNPQVSENTLTQVLDRITDVIQSLEKSPEKTGGILMGNDWLMDIRSKILIPGGYYEFDIPAYHAWKNRPAAIRQKNLIHWAESLQPLSDALTVTLGLLRDTGFWRAAHTRGGQFQQNLPVGRSHQLLRLRFESSLDVFPELMGHPLMVSVRLMRVDADGRSRAYAGDATFEVALCT